MAHLITGGPSPPPPSLSREGNGGTVIFHVWARKTKVIHLLFSMQDDGCKAMHKASTGYIPPCREGERGKLTDSEACSLLCHLLLEQYGRIPAITQDLWKSHNLVPVLTGWSFSGLYLVLLGRKGVCWLLLVQKHVIQSATAFDSTGPQYHVSPCNGHGSLFLTSQAFWSIIFLIYCMLHDTLNKKRDLLHTEI